MRVRELLMSFQDVMACPSELVFPHFLIIVVEVRTPGPRHVVVGKKGYGPCINAMMLKCYKCCINAFAPTKPVFMSVEFYGDYRIFTMLRRIWPPPVLGILPDWCLPVYSLSVEK